MSDGAAKLLLGNKDVARLLGVNRHDVARFEKEGALASVNLPGRKHKKYTIEAIHDFVRRQQSCPAIVPAAHVDRAKNQPKLTQKKQGQSARNPYPVGWERGIRGAR